MTEPTKKPWEVIEMLGPLDDWTGSHFAIRAPRGAPGGIALVFGGLGLEEERANANLIAAAPDMYAVLGACSHALRSYQYGNVATDLAAEMADTVDEVIAKADGAWRKK